MTDRSTPSRRQILSVAPGAMLAATASVLPAQAGPGDRVLAGGTTRIMADTVVEGHLVFQPGARIDIADGATLTLRGDLIAPTDRLFWGRGRIDLTRSRVLAARPEWWGAAADDANVDCEPALAACLAAHPAMLLGPGDYRLARTWTIDRSNRRIWGVGRSKDARGTRLLLTQGGSGIVVRVGTEAQPRSINGHVTGVDLRWIELGRTAAASDDGAIGLAVRHVLDCRFEGLRANEHAIGYSLRGAVRTYLDDCRAFRSLAGGVRDDFVGFDMDGSAPPFATGANASLYLTDCNATTGGRPRLARSIGARLTGAMSDTFLTRFETTEVDTGIVIDGSPATRGARSRFAQVDIHIDTPVLDQCGSTGIAIEGLDRGAMLEVRSPYVALGSGGGTAIRIARGAGSVSVSGGQLIGSVGGETTGFALDSVSGVAAAGTMLRGFDRPVVADGVRDFELAVAIEADAAGKGAAIAVRDCARGYLRPRVFGTAGGYRAGVAIDGASQALSIESVGIDRAAVGGLAVSVDGREAAAGGTMVTVASRP